MGEEIATFLYNEGADELFSLSTLYKRMKELGYSKKFASVEAYQASRPDVLWKEHCFFNFGLPAGINGEPRCKFIDVDEFSITLEKCNRTSGWALVCRRVRKEGHYARVGNKLTVLMGIEPGDGRVPAGDLGSLDNPRRWVSILQNSGTTINHFSDFCDLICNDIEQFPVMPTDQHRIFLWDNLNSHHANYVNQRVTGREGVTQWSIVPRPPYMPKYGPIEYKICDVTHECMKRKLPGWDVPRLEQEVRAAVQRIGPFDSTFQHCGYKWTHDDDGNVIAEEE
jgi:hypothetical protein